MTYLQKTYALIWQRAPLYGAAFISAGAAVHSDFMGERAKSAMLWAATALTCFSAFGPNYVSDSQMQPLVSEAELKNHATRVRVLGALLFTAPLGALLMHDEPILSSLMWGTGVAIVVALSHVYHDLLLAKKPRFGEATGSRSTESLALLAGPSAA